MRKSFFIILLSSTTIIAIIATFFAPRSHEVQTAEGATTIEQNDMSGNIDPTKTAFYFEGKPGSYSFSDLFSPPTVSSMNVLAATNEEKWIEVDLSDQVLKAWQGTSLFLETRVSTGLPRTPTPQGVFNIWIKLRATKMEGGTGRGYYYLPNVPYVMFFQNEKLPGWKGYGLHGTYWHNDFGNQRSHGCVNLPTPVAKQLYEWVTPILPEGKGTVRATVDNPGTRIVIHE